VEVGFARDDDELSPDVYVAVDASGELVTVLQRDGTEGVVHDVAAGETRRLDPLNIAVDGVFALRHAPYVVAWWIDGDGLGYASLDLASATWTGRWSVAGGGYLAAGPDDTLRVLRQRAAEADEGSASADDDPFSEIDALIALAESFAGLDGPWEIARVARPGAEPEREVELPEDGDYDRAWISPDGRWVHDAPGRLRRDDDLRLKPTAGGDDVVLAGTAGLRVVLVVFPVGGDHVRLAAADRRELRVVTYALSTGERVAETRFDAPLYAAWALGDAGVAASWVDELLVWRDPVAGAAPLHLAQPGEAGLASGLGVAADPTGVALAASDGASLAVHRLDALAPSHRLPHEREITGVAAAAMAPRLVTCDGVGLAVTSFGADGGVGSERVHRVASGAPAIFGPAVDAAGRRLAWCLRGSGNGAACLEVGRGVPRDVAFGRTAMAIAVHPTGELLAVATGDVDGTVELLRWDDHAVVGRFTVENAVYLLAFSGDGGRLAVASRSGELSLWALASGTPLARATVEIQRFDELVAAVAFGDAGATFLTHAGAAHRLGDDGVRAVSGRDLGGTPAASPGGRFVAVRTDRHRVALRRMPGGEPIRELLVEAHGAVALLAGGRVVTVDTEGRALTAHACPEAVDPIPPSSHPALSAVGEGESWATLDAPPTPTGLSGQAAHHWRALRRSLWLLAPARGLDEGAVEELVVGTLPRAARLVVALDAMVRMLAILEVGRSSLSEDDGAPPRGGALAIALADRLGQAGRFSSALEPEDVSWAPAERELLFALLEVDEPEVFGEMIAALADQYAFEAALCRRRDALPGTRPSVVDALHVAGSLDAALGVVAADLAGISPEPADGLLALVSDLEAPDEASAAAGVLLDLREDGPSAHLVALPRELLGALDELEARFTLRCVLAGLLKP